MTVSPLLKLAGDSRRLLSSAVREEELKRLREHKQTGRLLDDDGFPARLEKRRGRALRRQKPGREPKRRRNQVWCPRNFHVIRTNRIPFQQSRASWPLMVTTAIIMAMGDWLPSSPIGPWLGFTPLPLLYCPCSR